MMLKIEILWALGHYFSQSPTTSKKILLTNSKHRHTPKRNEVHMMSNHECISVRNVNYDHKLHLSVKIAVIYHQLGV